MYPNSPTALTDPLDILLADVAIRIQLSQTDYSKAIQRYETINHWIDRDDSPLKDRVEVFYPQGSMAIGAAISSRLTTDEFDLDIVAQLNLPEHSEPKHVLDLLYSAITGTPGSRYHGKTKRNTRCVTVQYRDKMHLDVTPMVRRPFTRDRESWIFHHRPEDLADRPRRLVANPYGFAQWFNDTTPVDRDFVNAYEAREREYLNTQARADADPVPAQEAAFQKSRAVIALQLMKRWRNVLYEERPGRRPPSVLFSQLVADAANNTSSLSRELLLQAQHMLSVFQQAQMDARLVHIVNPVCPSDELTDRWPGNLAVQATFVDDLKSLVQTVITLASDIPLDRMKDIMVELFGEQPTTSAVKEFNRRMGNAISSGTSQHYAPTGQVAIPSTGALGLRGSSTARSTPKHTFYGEP